jgi:hypothetical protein
MIVIERHWISRVNHCLVEAPPAQIYAVPVENREEERRQNSMAIAASLGNNTVHQCLDGIQFWTPPT